MKTKVLFLCTGNSCRSQMAEGFLRAYGGEQFEAHSAGTKPSTVNPFAVEVMREAGIDISGQWSKNVTDYLGQYFPIVVTVCDNAKEHCPIFPVLAYANTGHLKIPPKQLGRGSRNWPYLGRCGTKLELAFRPSLPKRPTPDPNKIFLRRNDRLPMN